MRIVALAREDYITGVNLASQKHPEGVFGASKCFALTASAFPEGKGSASDVT